MLKITYKKTDNLIPYVSNSRTHSESQVEQIASSILEYGFTNPILLDDESGVIAGHGRLLAAKYLTMDEVPTITLTGLTEVQKKSYVIADNKIALNAGWNDDLLKAELEFLGDEDFDLELLGWDVLPNFEEEIDYSILDDEPTVGSSVTQEVEDMSTSVKKAIMIEFDPEHYDDARALADWFRKQGAYLGYMFLSHLKAEKEKQDKL